MKRQLHPGTVDEEGLLDPSRVGEVTRAFLGGETTATRLDWTLLMLELWQEHSSTAMSLSQEEDAADAVLAHQNLHADPQLFSAPGRGGDTTERAT